MLRIGLRLMLVSVPLFLIGFASLSSVWFEVARLVGVTCLTASFALLLLFYARTPAPDK